MRVPIVLLLAVMALLPGRADAVTPEPAPLTTPWTARVSTTDPLPEYPRPQLRRTQWRSLNGEWEYGTGLPAGPDGGVLGERVLVPFPVTSALSGIARKDTEMTYRRTFRVPAGWAERRVLLHFGAVTNRATVYVNGKEAGRHTGSYDPFSLDVTDVVRRGADNQLVVAVTDQAVTEGQPVGKQFPVSFSVLFTAASGIWQTVWLEPVAPTHVEAVRTRPDLRRRLVHVRPVVDGPRAGIRQRVTVLDGRRRVGRSTGPAGARLRIRVPRPHLWTPEDPHLYGLRVELLGVGGKAVDRVRAHVGMRSVGLVRRGGITRLALNGKPIFQVGTLDQGYWPDGLYTAPTDAALRSDIQASKRFGFNMVRKHVKVESDRWYWWADRMGLLVWQDMPNTPIYRPPGAAQKRSFERQLRAMVDRLRDHPSIVGWVPFNEGWGQFDVDRITRAVKRWDPSRLVNGHSGAANCCLAVEPKGGDVRDTHMYSGPFAPRPDARASMTGEFGGLAVRTPGHEWPGDEELSSTPIRFGTRAGLAGLVRRQWAALGQQVRAPGLSGAVFVELTDVERELAGLITYDRRVNKVAPSLMRRLNARLLRAGARPGRPQGPRRPGGAAAVHTFDEASGDTARDATSGDHDLALRGARRVRGWVGRALAFDGGSARAVADGPVVDTRRSFTVAAWLRRDGAAPRTAPAVAQLGADAAGFGLGLEAEDERADLELGYPAYGLEKPMRPPVRWTFAVPGGLEADTGYGDGDSNPPAGRWQHVVGVVDRATGTASLSVNGVPVDVRSAPATWRAVGPLVLGGADAAGGEGFRGAVDELRIFTRALSPAAVRRLFAAERRR